MDMERIEYYVNRARAAFKRGKDRYDDSPATAEAIEQAEATINSKASSAVLNRAVLAGFLNHPLGAARYYIRLNEGRYA